MKSFICAHCNHSFKEERALIRHQDTSKKCLEIQTDEMIDDLDKAKTKIEKMKKQIKEFKETVKTKDAEIAKLRYLLSIKQDTQHSDDEKKNPSDDEKKSSPIFMDNEKKSYPIFMDNEKKTLLEMLQNGEFSKLSVSDTPTVASKSVRFVEPLN